MPGGGPYQHSQTEYIKHGSAKATKIESSHLKEIPLQMLPMGMWGPENMTINQLEKLEAAKAA